jgi:hypothetical protein
LKENVNDKNQITDIYVLQKGHSLFITGTWEHKVSAAQELADTQFGLKCSRPGHKILS